MPLSAEHLIQRGVHLGALVACADWNTSTVGEALLEASFDRQQPRQCGRFLLIYELSGAKNEKAPLIYTSAFRFPNSKQSTLQNPSVVHIPNQWYQPLSHRPIYIILFYPSPWEGLFVCLLVLTINTSHLHHWHQGLTSSDKARVPGRPVAAYDQPSCPPWENPI